MPRWRGSPSQKTIHNYLFKNKLCLLFVASRKQKDQLKIFEQGVRDVEWVVTDWEQARDVLEH